MKAEVGGMLLQSKEQVLLENPQKLGERHGPGPASQPPVGADPAYPMNVDI